MLRLRGLRIDQRLQLKTEAPALPARPCSWVGRGALCAAVGPLRRAAQSCGGVSNAAYSDGVKPDAQGWYRDPYGLHEDRYFSAGVATKLVRDGETESYDEPPDRPFPDAPLVPAPSPEDEEGHGSDLRRADEASNDDPYSAEAAKQRAFDVFDIGWPI